MRTTWASIVVCVLSSSCLGGVEIVQPDGGERERDAAPPDAEGIGRDAAQPEGAPTGGQEAATCGWTPYNDGLSGAAITDVVFDNRAAPGTVYATTSKSIYQSTDSGFTWHLQGTYSFGVIGFLALPGSDPSVLLASSTEGVIVSNDAGKTWTVLAFDGVATQYVAVAPSQSLRVYASVAGAGLFRSDDSGQTFSAVNEGVPYGDVIAIDVAPDNADEAVAVMMLEDTQSAWSDSIVLRTANGGATWSSVLSGAGYAWNARRCAANPDVVYVATSTGIARSNDRGATFNVIPTPYLVEDVEVSQNDCDDIYVMVQYEGPFHSTDGGNTLGPALTQGLNLQPPGTWPGRMAIDPSGSDVVLGSHGGLWVSNAPVASWTLAQGILGISVSALSASPADPGELWLSSWGSGVWKRPSSAQPWQRVSVANLPLDYDFTVVSDAITPRRVFVGGWYTLYESTDDSTFNASTLSDNELSIAFDPSRPNVVYVGTQLAGLFKSMDSGATFVASNAGITPWTTQTGSSLIDVRWIAVDPASPDTVYIGTNGAGVWKSVDGAQSWANIGLAGTVESCLLVVPGASSTVYACVSGQGIRQSVDGGVTWTDFTTGLPSLDEVGLLHDSTTGYFYVSSETGVYVRRGDAAWTGFDLECIHGAGPSAIVTEGSTRRLVTASQGGVVAHAL
jgi:hypothetical protein